MIIPELMLNVFGNFEAELLVLATHIFRRTASPRNPVNPSRGHMYSPLVQSSLVCKSWYLLATEILYSQVILMLNEQILSFARSIRHNPPLARYVKSFFCMETPNIRYVARVISQANIIHILHTCDSIGALSLSLCNGPSLLTTLGARGHPSTLSRLRRLTLQRSLHDTLEKGLMFPALEYLCYQGSLPHGPMLESNFPRLQKICFVNVSWSFESDTGPMRLLASLATLPRLESLRFIECTIPSTSFPLPYIPQLRELCLVGHALNDFRWSQETLSEDEGGQLQHLTISAMHRYIQTALQEWSIPHTLESLTIYIDTSYRPKYDHHRSPEHTSTFYLLQFLEVNSSAIRSGPFRTLTLHILCLEPMDIDDPAESLIQRVEVKCSELGIIFKLEESRK